jgi:OOP family OmpA-OmpF porin
MGLRYKFSHNFALSLEANIGSLNGDRLDAAEHALSENDKYGYTSLGVVYTFGNNKETVPTEYHPVPEEDRTIQEKLDSLDQALNDVDEKVDEVNDKVDQLAARWEGPDSDNDGISDSFDKESNTKPDALVNHEGVSINECCDKLEEMTQKPDVSTGQFANSDIAYESVYFGLNSTYITPDNMKKVAKVAKIMNKNKDVKFKIVGSACKISSDNYNKNLSKRRAQSVKDALVENFGISADRITIDFVGEDDPVAKEPLYINRRADFFMIK